MQDDPYQQDDIAIILGTQSDSFIAERTADGVELYHKVPDVVLKLGDPVDIGGNVVVLDLEYVKAHICSPSTATRTNVSKNRYSTGFAAGAVDTVRSIVQNLPHVKEQNLRLVCNNKTATRSQHSQAVQDESLTSAAAGTASPSSTINAAAEVDPGMQQHPGTQDTGHSHPKRVTNELTAPSASSVPAAHAVENVAMSKVMNASGRYVSSSATVELHMCKNILQPEVIAIVCKSVNLGAVVLYMLLVSWLSCCICSCSITLAMLQHHQGACICRQTLAVRAVDADQLVFQLCTGHQASQVAQG